MQLSLLAQALWAAGSVELAALLVVLFVRRRWRKFPLFTAFIAFQVLETTLLYAIHRFGSHTTYFWAYWASAVVDLSLQILVVFELARIVLKPTGTWVSDARKMFLLLTAAGILIAAVAAYGVNPTVPKSLDDWIEKGNLFAAMLNAQLFAATAFASTRLGLAWRHHVMGIATGWAFWAVVGLFVEAAYSYLGANWHGVVLDQIRILAFQIATIYWTFNLWLPEPEHRKLSSEMLSYLSGLRKLTQPEVQSIHSIDRR